MTKSTVGFSREDAFLILNGMQGVGPVMMRRLLERFNEDPVSVLHSSEAELMSVKGVGKKATSGIQGWRDGNWLELERGRIAKHGARFITVEDGDYPQALLETFDPPIGLYCQGSPPREPCVAIVGTRQPTLYGQNMARRIASGLANSGFCVVSGMARGIDAAAHEGALESSGRTVAVFGCGLDVIYPPEHLNLYRRIVETGAVVSEFPFGRRADRQTFPMRNRVVAGMCVGVVVVESSAVGGSMITARFAGEQGRQVFAVPGRADQPTAVGCHKLIREGATLVTHAEQVIEEVAPSLGLSLNASLSVGDSDASSGKAAPDNLSSCESTVYACLNDGSILTSDCLCERTSLPVHEVAAALTMLELKRLVSRCKDGSFEVR